MHDSSMNIMRKFLSKFDREKELKILDVGSYCYDGHENYRSIMSSKWVYTGLDIRPGPNVDVVSEREYSWPFEDGNFDLVISGQAAEHVEDLKSWFIEIGRVTKSGGIVFIIAPTILQKFHQKPIDCWRIMPDGMLFMLRIAGLVDCRTRGGKRDSKSIDIVGTGRKP